MTVRQSSVLGSDRPVGSLDEYLRSGGGRPLAIARRGNPETVIEEIKSSGLRGRGGAGFPTGVKWTTVRNDPCPQKYVVCNAAEGEPGTFKDRWLLRLNPYQVLEGIAIAAYAVGAERAYVGIKGVFQKEIEILEGALKEMDDADMLKPVSIDIVRGPDEYLFGEEKAMIEVIEGNDALPRIFPPYQIGLFAKTGSSNPTVVNNVETFANVPAIMRAGAGWFRSFGTPESPGTMVFTLVGDVRVPGVYELPLGTTLRELIYDIGGGPAEGRTIKAIFPGSSHSVITVDQLDTPLDFDSMKSAGTGLGSGGFVVYDDSTCIVEAALVFSRFLHTESCAQCPPCKTGTQEFSEIFERIERGEGSSEDLKTAKSRCSTVTGGALCYLPTGASLVMKSALESFGDEFEQHLGAKCDKHRDLPLPKLVDFDETSGKFTFDQSYEPDPIAQRGSHTEGDQEDGTEAEDPGEEDSGAKATAPAGAGG